ncbi:MAG: CBS domain-containing protein [Planctomycetota bacterium]
MLVRDIMTSHVVTIDMDASVGHVCDVFDAAAFRHLVVVEGGKVVGILSDRDAATHVSPFLGKMAERNQDLATLKRRVHQIMTRDPFVAVADEPVYKAGDRMIRERISSLPVVNAEHQIEGIVTLTDVAKIAVDRLSAEAAAEAARDADAEPESGASAEAA